MLFTRYGINYNKIPAYFRKGSTLVRIDPDAEKRAALALEKLELETKPSPDTDQPAAVENNTPVRKQPKLKPYEGISGEIVIVHEDIIKNAFWVARPWLLA